MAPKNPAREILYFDPIKEARSTYFVEYRPPVSNSRLATLNLIYPESYDLAAVAETMEGEANYWLKLFPVALVVWAWDATENQIRPRGDLDDGFLICWYAFGTTTLNFSWKLRELPKFLSEETNLPDWRTIYKDVPLRTDIEVKANAMRQSNNTRKQILTLKIILAVWLAVIPAAWAIVQYLGPEWLAIAVLLYSLWQASRTARKLFGRIEPSKSQKEKAEKDFKQDHYFYHCERNLEGFNRLKAENFEREAKERTFKEAADLRNKVAE